MLLLFHGNPSNKRNNFENVVHWHLPPHIMIHSKHKKLPVTTQWSRHLTGMCPAELQRRSSKVLVKRSLWSLLKVGKMYVSLYQASTTLGLEPV